MFLSLPTNRVEIGTENQADRKVETAKCDHQVSVIYIRFRSEVPGSWSKKRNDLCYW